MTPPPGFDDVPELVQPPAPAPAAGLASGSAELPELQVATLRRRVLAELVDASIVMAVAFLAVLPIWLARGSFTGDSGLLGLPDESTTQGATLLTALENTIVLVTWVAYSALFSGRSGGWNGQTPGRRAADIRIAGVDGSGDGGAGAGGLGGPLTGRAAWTRALVIGLLASGPVVAGALIDAFAGTTPTAYFIGPFAGIGLSFVALLPALAGDRRRALHDRVAGTVVLRSKPANLPLGAAVPSSADGGPLPARILPLRVGAATYGFTALLIATAVGTVLLGRAIDDIQPSKAEFAATLAEPENVKALDDLREVEAIVRSCLTDGGTPNDCQWPVLPSGSKVELAEEFDTSVDPIGAHAGKVGASTDEDGEKVYVFGFTSGDRVWYSEVSKNGDVFHSCLTRDEDICDGVGFHEW